MSSFRGSLLLLLSLAWQVCVSQAFQSPQPQPQTPQRRRSPNVRFVASSEDDKTNGSAGGYDKTDGASKGLVGTLTNLVNTLAVPFTATREAQGSAAAADDDWGPPPPDSPTRVLERIRDDYVERNYLWTGDVDLATFTVDCVFQDPTIRFEGRETFVTNVNNIRKVTDALLGPCRSELRSIQLVENSSDSDKSSYVETTWRMVGLLRGLPWQPCIDVPGRTKFWIQAPRSGEEDDVAWQVYLYEEEWGIPAAQALWQILTPSGTYPEPEASSPKESKASL